MILPALRKTLAPSLLIYAAGCGEVKNTPLDGNVPVDAGGEVDGPVDAPPSMEPPVNTLSAGTVDEGATLSLAGRLVTTDPDTPAQGLTYTVTALPSDGVLKKNGTDVEVGGTFTQKDVADGNISYVHGGGEDGGDSFDWELTDGTNNIPTTLFAITVNPVNDAPTIVNNPTSTVAEGGTKVLDNAALMVTDVENGVITYTFVSAVRGELQRRVGAGPFIALTAGQTFTQQDITDGNIRFVDPGTDDALLQVQSNTTASFSWRVDDGQGGVNPSATGANVTNFTVTSVDDPPVVVWKALRCSANSNMNILAAPIVTLTDPDNTMSQYQVCVVSIGAGKNVTPSSTGLPGVTTLPIPVLQNGTANMAVNGCVVATSQNSLNLDAAVPAPTGPNDYRGSVTYRLLKNGTQWLSSHTVQFPVGTQPGC